eukprot:CAMPEP_0194550474 /NCGR_PEP_ID=MMETSP0253-20130528/95727_1 /TAXON_ID=2966 /ORGANISM="Noctiluca scintillans" /LENGTH=202 /DNA_ID=CAMNT_0039397913 /DNA_START=408 /DNA_END=1018 /DNA_ORIENTATION=-
MATTISINAKLEASHRAAGLPDLSSPRQKMLKRTATAQTPTNASEFSASLLKTVEEQSQSLGLKQTFGAVAELTASGMNHHASSGSATPPSQTENLIKEWFATRSQPIWLHGAQVLKMRLVVAPALLVPETTFVHRLKSTTHLGLIVVEAVLNGCCLVPTRSLGVEVVSEVDRALAMSHAQLEIVLVLLADPASVLLAAHGA